MNSEDAGTAGGGFRQEFRSLALILLLLLFLLFGYVGMSGPAMAFSGCTNSFCGLTYDQVMFLYAPLISLAESCDQSQRIDDYVNWCILSMGLGGAP